jgi:PTH1 family peptidyl-tRNA hydrolase
MKLIVGLGNPGKDYALTRHNVGFLVIDELSRQLNIALDKNKFNGKYGIGHVGAEKVIVCKPYTYMNLSGEFLRPLMIYYDVDIEDILVVYDDLDLTVGKIRLRTKGSAGGHNGVKSIISHLGTQSFKRIRIGIDRPRNSEKIVDYVLGSFTKDEVPLMDLAVQKSTDACQKWVSNPFSEVMNVYNQS